MSNNVQNIISDGYLEHVYTYQKEPEYLKFINVGNGRLEKKLNNNPPSLFGYYYNDLTKTELQDDCSSFVSAVINLFVQENKQIKNKFDKYKHYTSVAFLTDKVIKELGEVGFRCYEGETDDNDKYKLKRLEALESGDILVRKGHVEIYLGNNWSFGWGEVHNSYEDNPDSKNFKWHFGIEDEVENSNNPTGYYFYNSKRFSEGQYTRVYRYEGK